MNVDLSMLIFGKILSSEQMVIYRQSDDSQPHRLDNTDYVKMASPRPPGDWHARADGKWYAGDPAIELNFVSEEAGLISNELLKHEDEDPSAIASETAWREYRKQLRRWNWQDNEYFPDPAHRPVRPQ